MATIRQEEYAEFKSKALLQIVCTTTGYMEILQISQGASKHCQHRSQGLQAMTHVFPLFLV